MIYLYDIYNILIRFHATLVGLAQNRGHAANNVYSSHLNTIRIMAIRVPLQ